MLTVRRGTFCYVKVQRVVVYYAVALNPIHACGTRLILNFTNLCIIILLGSKNKLICKDIVSVNICTCSQTETTWLANIWTKTLLKSTDTMNSQITGRDMCNSSVNLAPKAFDKNTMFLQYRYIFL